MTVRTFCCFAICLSVALLCGTGLLSAGERTDLQGIGMARTFAASTHGLDAVGINPANLIGGDREYMIQFGLPRIGMHVGSDFLTLDLYEKYFTGVMTDSGRVGRYLTDADKQDILNAFPDGVGTIAADAEIRPIGIMVNLEFGALALTVSDRIASSAAIPHQYAQFLFYGNTPGSVYDFSQTRAVASWTREYSLTFATGLPDLAVFHGVTGGIGVKFVQGFAYAELDRFNTSLITGMTGVLTGALDLHARTSHIDELSDNYQGGFNPFPAPAGTGVGFDLGVAGSLTDYLRVGLSVIDIGSIRWTRNVEETTADSTIVVSDPLDPDQNDGIQDAVNGKKHPGADVTTSLPTVLRVGVAVDLHKLPLLQTFFPGELVVAADYNQGFAETAGSTSNPRLSLGMQWTPLPFLPLRTGVSFGGTDHYNWAIGFGFHLGVFDIDLASENVSWLFATKGTSYGSAAVGMKLNF
jgi:hypothetical protein